MGFGAIIAGFILLFNPVINVVDVIPDAIGFFLIVGGLTKMSYFIGKIAQARDLMLKLAFVEVIKIFSIALIPYTSGSALLLMSFVFGFVELLLFIPAVNNLFEGLSFAGLWYNGTAIYAKKVKKVKVKKKDGTAAEENKEIELLTGVKKFVIFFYSFRVCATLIPELTELEMYDFIGEVNAFRRSWVSYKPAFYVLFGIATLILGIIFVKKIVSFFGPIKNDKPFIDSLNRKYTDDILPKETFFIAQNMKRAMMLFTLSAIASFIFFVDGINLLVGIISSALLIAAAIIVRKYVKLATVVIPIAAVRGALSIVTLILQYKYFYISEYSVEAVQWIEKAYNQYYIMAAVECVEYIIALASVLLFLTSLMKAVKAHLEVCGMQTENAQYSKRNRDLETYNTIGGKLLLCSIITIINYAFDCSYHYLMPNMASITILTTLTSAVSIIYIAYVIHTVSTINTLLYDKEIEMN